MGHSPLSARLASTHPPTHPTKHAPPPKVIDLLIFKGRQELETYLTLHKNRHHAISEYLDPVIKKNKGHTLPPPQRSKFMSDFLEGNYAVPTGK